MRTESISSTIAHCFAFVFADNEMITSFENPNYHLNDDDALNSNIATPLTPAGSSQYYQSDQLYEDAISNSKRRRNYANIDLTSMGIDLDRTVHTPDSECSLDSRRSAESDVALRSDGQDTSETSEDSSDDSDEDLTPEPKRASFLEYYSSLERSLTEHDTTSSHRQRAESKTTTTASADHTRQDQDR